MGFAEGKDIVIDSKMKRTWSMAIAWPFSTATSCLNVTPTFPLSSIFQHCLVILSTGYRNYRQSQKIAGQGHSAYFSYGPVTCLSFLHPNHQPLAKAARCIGNLPNLPRYKVNGLVEVKVMPIVVRSRRRMIYEIDKPTS